MRAESPYVFVDFLCARRLYSLFRVLFLFLESFVLTTAPHQLTTLSPLPLNEPTHMILNDLYATYPKSI